jgi:hypothetical protein
VQREVIVGDETEPREASRQRTGARGLRQSSTMTASTSKAAPRGSALTATVERAG